MKSIKSLIAEEASVIRDGKQQLIPANDIVVGDITVLSTGDRVPADLRIVQMSSDLRFDRSLLTGERCVSSSIPSFGCPTPVYAVIWFQVLSIRPQTTHSKRATSLSLPLSSLKAPVTASYSPPATAQSWAASSKCLEKRNSSSRPSRRKSGSLPRSFPVSPLACFALACCSTASGSGPPILVTIPCRVRSSIRSVVSPHLSPRCALSFFNMFHSLTHHV